MKMYFRLLPLAALFFATVFTACKKETVSSHNTTDSTATEITTHADDQVRISTETEDVSNDATVTVEATPLFSGNSVNITPPFCDAVYSIDTTGTTKKIIVTYNSAHCSATRIRSGSVILSMAKGYFWKNAGATLTITYQNLKITRVHDNKTITLNGSHVITNTSGGLLANLATLKTITHTISSNELSITFDDNSKRTWQVAEKRVFTYNDGLVVTITGNHTEGSNSAIAIWGANRFGHAFTTSITAPLVIKQDCDFRLTSGMVTHAGFGMATVTYGLDAKGHATSCPGTGTYYGKVDWTGPLGHSYSNIFAY